MKLIFMVAKLAQRFPFKQRLILGMDTNSCVTRFKEIKAHWTQHFVAEKTLLGRKKLSGGGGGGWGIRCRIGVRMKHS